MDEFRQILDRAARYCSAGEKCSNDVREKMIGWGLGNEDADRAILYLTVNKFIDDERFAAFYVRDKLKFNKWGRIKLQFSLRQKKISREVIENSISSIDPSEYNAVLDQLVLSKARSLGDKSTQANKSKIIRFAAQRGFTLEEIFESINRVTL